MFRCERRFFLDGCTLSGLRGLRPPAAPYEVASRHFFDVASTPPHEEGTTPPSHDSFGSTEPAPRCVTFAAEQRPLPCAPNPYTRRIDSPSPAEERCPYCLP